MSNELKSSNLRAQLNPKTLVILGASASFVMLLNTPALGQDWKPGDPIPFGAAHKSMFDTSTPVGAPGSSRVLSPGTTSSAQSSAGVSSAVNPATSAAASAQPNAMDNFLNSRSIEWKPGDPVGFGTAHHPIATGKSINDENNQSLNAVMPSTPINTPSLQAPSSAPVPVIGAVNAPLQDLSPAPGAGRGLGRMPAGQPSTMPGWAPALPGPPVQPGGAGFATLAPPGNYSGKKNESNKSNGNNAKQAPDSQQKQKSKSKNKKRASTNDVQNSLPMNQSPGFPTADYGAAGTGSAPGGDNASSKKSGASGNIFSHAFHWIFGGN
jgi:hypothetical protein